MYKQLLWWIGKPSAARLLATNPHRYEMSMKMDEKFFSGVLKHPPKSYSDALFDDESNVIWIDWREESESIVKSVAGRVASGDIKAKLIEFDNEWGYTIAVSNDANVYLVEPTKEFGEQQQTLLAIQNLLSPEYQIRFVGDTNGSDTIGIVILSLNDWEKLYKMYGRRLNEHFCPIEELPDLLGTPGNEIDEAIQKYANSS